MRLGGFLRGIVRAQAKVNLVAFGGDDVINHHAVLQDAAQLDPASIFAGGDQAGGVSDHRVLAPIGCLRVGAAIGLEVQDLYLSTGNLLAADPQIIIFPRELQRGALGSRHLGPGLHSSTAWQDSQEDKSDEEKPRW